MLPGSGRPPRLRWLWMPALALALAGCDAATRPTRLTAISREWTRDGLTGRRISTEHFEIISTLRDAEFEAALPEFVEATYRRYVALLPPPPEPAPKMTTYLFGSRPEWRQFTMRHYPSRYAVYSRIRTGGYTEQETSVSFYVTRSATLATLAHEGWHQYVGSRFDTPIPAWLNEGLACYYEAVEFAGSKPTFTPRRNTFRVNSLRHALQMGETMSLAEVVDTDVGQVITRGTSRTTQTYYAQAWALVTFLRHQAGARRAGAFDRMLEDIAGGSFNVRIGATRLSTSGGAQMGLGSAAFRAYFGCPPEAMEDAYNDHLIQLCGF